MILDRIWVCEWWVSVDLPMRHFDEYNRIDALVAPLQEIIGTA